MSECMSDMKYEGRNEIPKGFGVGDGDGDGDGMVMNGDGVGNA